MATRIPQEVREQARNLKAEGMPISMIAETLSISESSVSALTTGIRSPKKHGNGHDGTVQMAQPKAPEPRPPVYPLITQLVLREEKLAIGIHALREAGFDAQADRILAEREFSPLEEEVVRLVAFVRERGCFE